MPTDSAYVPCTAMVPLTFGSRCRKRITGADTPLIFAVVTKSRLATDIAAALTMRVMSGTVTSTMLESTAAWPGPTTAAMRIASTIDGTE